jgi:polyvinyl alcohol dehydrogenase (cytochrome)
MTKGSGRSARGKKQPKETPMVSKSLAIRFIVPIVAAGGAAYAIACSSSSSSGNSATSTDKPPVAQPDCSPASTDWPMFGQNVCNTASQPDDNGLSRDTVGKLAVKWVYDAKAGAAGEVSATPAVVGGKVYFPDWGGMINCLDAATGKPIWSKKIADLLTEGGKPGSLGGWAARNTPLVTQGLVIFGTVRDPPEVITNPGPGSYLIAIDQNTAAVKWITLLDEHLASVVSGSPVLDGNTMYIGVSSQEEYGGLAAAFGIKYTCCSFRGSVAAVDVASGNVVWKKYTITDELFWGPGGMPEAGPADAAPPPVAGYAGVAVWSSTPVIDRKRHQLIVTTGDNYNQPMGTEGVVPGNWVDAVVALDLASGNLNWATQLPDGGKAKSDDFATGVSNGPDSDFGAGANLFTANINGAPKDLIGAGQKSGVYFALDPEKGNVVWQTNVGPGGGLGGIHWGTATDGTRIYVGNNNGRGASLALLGKGAGAGKMITTGTWAALDPATGDVLWQVADPAMSKPLAGGSVNAPVTVVNGVMFGGSMDANGTMFALDATSGQELWHFESGGTVYGGPAIVGGVVYWGSGYPGKTKTGQLVATRPLGFGTSSTKGALFAFAVP